MESESLRAKGLKYRNARNHTKAIDVFLKLKESCPDNQRVYVDLSICYRKIREFGLARKELLDILCNEKMVHGEEAASLA